MMHFDNGDLPEPSKKRKNCRSSFLKDTILFFFSFLLAVCSQRYDSVQAHKRFLRVSFHLPSVPAPFSPLHRQAGHGYLFLICAVFLQALSAAEMFSAKSAPAVQCGIFLLYRLRHAGRYGMMLFPADQALQQHFSNQLTARPPDSGRRRRRTVYSNRNRSDCLHQGHNNRYFGKEI